MGELLHLNLPNYLSLFGSSQTCLGPWGNTRRMTAASTCTSETLKSSVKALLSAEGGAPVVNQSVRRCSCWWWVQVPTPRYLNIERILLLNDNLGWREDENPCWKVVHFCLLSQWITFAPVRLKIWNSLLVGNSARKSPREFRLMINLLPVAKRLVNADGQKVSRYHFHLYLGHFLYLPLFHWVTVSTSLQSKRRSVCSYQQVSSVAAEWRSWAHVTACVRAAELQILKAVEMLPALRGLEICCGWWKPDWRNGQKRFGWF